MRICIGGRGVLWEKTLSDVVIISIADYSFALRCVSFFLFFRVPALNFSLDIWCGDSVNPWKIGTLPPSTPTSSRIYVWRAPAWFPSPLVVHRPCGLKHAVQVGYLLGGRNSTSQPWCASLSMSLSLSLIKFPGRRMYKSIPAVREWTVVSALKPRAIRAQQTSVLMAPGVIITRDPRVYRHCAMSSSTHLGKVQSISQSKNGKWHAFVDIHCEVHFCIGLWWTLCCIALQKRRQYFFCTWYPARMQQRAFPSLAQTPRPTPQIARGDVYLP